MVATVVVSVISCSKQIEHPSYQTLPAPLITPIVSNQEIFWAQPWRATQRGYEIDVYPALLTDSAINKGVDVGVAIYSEMTTFETLPRAFYEYTQRDSVYLSCVVTPHHLQIVAQASFDLGYMSSSTYLSDILIRYR
jgi:hypothetical protein